MINGAWNIPKLYNTLSDHIALYKYTTDIEEPNDRDYTIWNDIEKGYTTWRQSSQLLQHINKKFLSWLYLAQFYSL